MVEIIFLSHFPGPETVQCRNGKFPLNISKPWKTLTNSSPIDSLIIQNNLGDVNVRFSTLWTYQDPHAIAEGFSYWFTLFFMTSEDPLNPTEVIIARRNREICPSLDHLVRFAAHSQR